MQFLTNPPTGVKVTVTPRGVESSILWEKLYGTVDPTMPAWGLPIPESATGGVSARLIWNNRNYIGKLEYLSDRAVRKGDNDIIKHEELGKYFNEICEGFRPFMSQNHKDWDNEDYILVEQGNFKCLLTCNGSCGYVYMGVWEEKSDD